MYKALKKFVSSGVTAEKGDELDIKNKDKAKFLVKVGFIEEIKKKKAEKKDETT